ncbi:SRPBCC family protein [Allokutzneria oryzae]|uniref:SRPBCC domain-containing protein n=1 Tax=Allokutzneria oryzae TaxID=1378989 RepID=A0ABV6AA25_9PSEU
MSREFEVREEVVLPATPEQVWAAVATPEGHAAWFMSVDDIGAENATAWDPPKRFATKTPIAEDGSFHAFEYLIEGREGSTVLRFVHSGVLTDEWSEDYEDMTAQGWTMYLHTLAEYLTHFPGRPATYVEAEGPRSSAAPEAWAKLEAVLGVSAVGDEVSLDVPGVPKVEGVVDYLLPTFVGVRTADGLYRFHGRSALGMVAAVGHHLYGTEIPAADHVEAWRTWLHDVFA